MRLAVFSLVYKSDVDFFDVLSTLFVTEMDDDDDDDGRVAVDVVEGVGSAPI